MLRSECLWLEVKILTFVVPLVSNIIPKVLMMRFEFVGLCNTEQWSPTNKVYCKVFWIVIIWENLMALFNFSVEGLTVFVGIGYSDSSRISFIERIQCVIISPVIRFMVMPTTKRETLGSKTQEGSSTY